MEVLVRMAEIVSGINYCQNKYIYGVNLHPDHIFVTQEGNLKLAGFHTVLAPKLTSKIWGVESSLISNGIKQDNLNLAKIFFMLATHTTSFPKDCKDMLQSLPNHWAKFIENALNNTKNTTIKTFRSFIYIYIYLVFLFEHLGECAKREAGISGKTQAEKRITTEQEIDNSEAATLVLPKFGGGTKTNVEDEELETMVLPKIGAGGTKKNEKKNLVPPQSITEDVVENLPDGNICIYNIM